MFNRKTSSLILSFSLIFSLGACSLTNTDVGFKQETAVYDPEPNPDVHQISTYHQEALDGQKEIEQKLIADYEKESYTFENPFVRLDPYDLSPLSALILFETEEARSIELLIGNGKDEELITKEFKQLKKIHEIPVFGLYPDKENKVILRAKNSKGQVKETTITIQTDPLPEDLMTTRLVSTHPQAMEPGLTFIVPNFGSIFAVDSNADVRWYSSRYNRLIFNRVENGHYLHTGYVEEDEANSLLMESDFLGKLYNAYHINIEGYDKNNLLHHDVIEMANGNLLATTHEPNSKYIEDHMHEIDRETGETTQEINVRAIMPEKASTEYDGKNASANDWLHQNAIWPDDDGRSILISGRSQDAILKLSYPDGEIEWILAANEDWPKEYEDKLLEPIGEVDFPAGQHAVKVIDHPEKNNPDEIKDVILFDNNDVIVRGDRELSRQYSQAIHYRVNEEEKTVEQIWHYGKNRGVDFYSSIVGNVQYLYEQDNIILSSGAIENDRYGTDYYGKVVEVDALESESGEVFELDIYGEGEGASEFFYRAYRYPIYPKGWSYRLFDDLLDS